MTQATQSYSDTRNTFTMSVPESLKYGSIKVWRWYIGRKGREKSRELFRWHEVFFLERGAPKFCIALTEFPPKLQKIFRSEKVNTRTQESIARERRAALERDRWATVIRYGRLETSDRLVVVVFVVVLETGDWVGGQYCTVIGRKLI